MGKSGSELNPELLLLYASKMTPRLDYILQLLLKDMLGIHFQFTDNRTLAASFRGALINYSPISINAAINIIPTGLMDENKIQDLNLPESTNWKGVPVFFQSSGGDIPFDIFSAAFFLVSRYEEYLPFTPDKHGRFPGKTSYAFKENFHRKPVINMWVRLLGEMLNSRFQWVKIKNLDFQYISSIDIDHAWAILHKPHLRTSLSLLKSLVKANLKDIKYKLDVLRGKIQDPFYSFPLWNELHMGIEDKIVLFFLVSNSTSFDMMTYPNNPHWQQLVLNLAGKYECGIHPSYRIGGDVISLQQEKSFLEKLIKRKVEKSRHHFLKMRFPDTYQALQKACIKEDYSMGFHDICGFRAGIAFPFYFFNLKENKSTDLKILPFAVMDRTLKDYMALDAESAMLEIEQIIESIKECGGLYISIWHNNSLGDNYEWEGWTDIYKRMNLICKNAGI
jgi:hypothetical protein